MQFGEYGRALERGEERGFGVDWMDGGDMMLGVAFYSLIFAVYGGARSTRDYRVTIGRNI